MYSINENNFSLFDFENQIYCTCLCLKISRWFDWRIQQYSMPCIPMTAACPNSYAFPYKIVGNENILDFNPIIYYITIVIPIHSFYIFSYLHGYHRAFGKLDVETNMPYKNRLYRVLIRHLFPMNAMEKDHS